MKPKSSAFLCASRIALLTISVSASVHAGTTWTAGGGANTNIDEALNWGGTVNAINGTTAASFATGGNAASMNVPARFTTLTFNRDDAGGFAVGGASTLSVNATTAGSTVNLAVSQTVANGVAAITSPLQVYTTGTTGALLNIKNLEDGVPAGSFLISGGISASDSTKPYAIRAGGTGVTVLGGTLSHVSAIQQVNSGTSSGKVIIDGSQNLGAATVNVPGTTSGTVSSAYTIQMGSSTADIQSWGATTINQNATILVKSTATLSGAVSVGANGANLVVDGTLSATTLSLGGATAACNLKIGGSAGFSGNVAIGATAGNLILGNAATNGMLSLSGGTISGNVTIGGAGANENNLALTKISGGTLALNGTHSYTGATNVNAGTLNLGGSIASPITVKAGATLGGEGSTSSSLTFDAGSSALQFDPGGTATDALSANTVDVSGAGIVYVSPTGSTTPLSTYTVLKRVTGSFSLADLSKFAMSTRGGNLSITGGGKEITLTAASSAPASLGWKGNDGTNPSFWDIATTLNWNNGGADRFYTGDAVTFDDSAASFSVSIQGASVSPGNMVFNNTTANPYNVSGSSIVGSGSLTKNNSGTVTFGNALSHTGGITVNAGVLNLTSSSNTFTGSIVITGGELGFSGSSIPGALNARPVTLSGGTITRTSNTTVTSDSQTLDISANGSKIQVDANANVTWRVGGKISGVGNWTKSGTGVLSLGQLNNTGPLNDFSGILTVTGGTLDIRHGDSMGSTAGGTFIQSAILLMQNFGQSTNSTITVDEPLDFSGASFLTGYCQETKNFTQQFNGTINVQNDCVLGISTARNSSATAPILECNGASIVTGTNSVLSLGTRPASYPAGSSAASQTINIAAAISGPGAVAAQGDAGSVFTLGAPGYSGNTTVNSGTLKLNAPNVNNESSTISIATSDATLELNFDESGGAVTDTLDKLFIGGVQQNAGVYKALDNVTDVGTPIAQITGPGTLIVTSNPPPAGGYTVWQSANGAGSQTVDQDHDNDGVANGIEYFLGGSSSTTGFTVLPGPVAGSVTWIKAATYTGEFGTGFMIQSSTDLTTWTDAASNASPGVPGTVYLSGNNVAYTLPTGAVKTFVRLLVTPN